MSAHRHSQASAQFTDSAQHGAGAELFLVEGDSAARSLCAVRQAATQAVLPLQGKPLNAARAGAERLRANVLHQQLAAGLGLADPASPVPGDALDGLRFGRVLLLFDPDADGIHIGALMLLYFARWQPALVEAGRLWMVRAPMFTLTSHAMGEVLPAFSIPHRDALLEHAGRAAPHGMDVHRQIGLASLPPALLRHWCVDAATRQCRQVGEEDIAAVRAALGMG